MQESNISQKCKNNNWRDGCVEWNPEGHEFIGVFNCLMSPLLNYDYLITYLLPLDKHLLLLLFHKETWGNLKGESRSLSIFTPGVISCTPNIIMTPTRLAWGHHVVLPACGQSPLSGEKLICHFSKDNKISEKQLQCVGKTNLFVTWSKVVMDGERPPWTQKIWEN